MRSQALRKPCRTVSIDGVTGKSIVQDAAAVRALSVRLRKRALHARLTAVRLVIEAGALRLHVDVARHLRRAAVP